TPAPPSTPAPAPPPEQRSFLARLLNPEDNRKDSFPYVNLYLPEGQASIRLRKLIRNVLFESQIDYRFVTGDISAFLRYKYYAHNYTYKIGLFDTIEFPNLGSSSSVQFQRVRGGLVLFELPRDFSRRYYFLLQDDHYTFGDLTQVDNKKSNIYTKAGYQFGSQFDERLNGIVGESRGRITPVLTAFRDAGTRFSVAAAVTESARISEGDYQYTKLEAEAVRRTNLTPESFFITRFHIGSFLTKQTIRGPEFPSFERYSIPETELFKLGGRDALKGVPSDTRAEGTQELHLTNEVFVPIFRNRDYTTGWLHWNTLYGVGYVGAGAASYDYSTLARSDSLAVHCGLGAETAFTVRDIEVLLSIVVSHPVRAPDDIHGTKVLFGIRTIR
ncbi:MAG TPA: hypothetical protein VEZ11_05095, partial [Thermoanaerobaculia bacterium]|nr:hypothetical protein [Thermoanaerobaculia bacterium]